MYRLIALVICFISCAHTGVSRRYKFTCADKSIAYAYVTQEELSGSADDIYNKISDICEKAKQK